MSVVGFDLGNKNCVVAVARNRGIDVLNDESKCETPAIVCFGEKQRFLGTAGAASSMMNPKNTISQIKRLIGRPYSDPELQQDLKALPFSVTEGPDGFPLIHAHYLGETRTFTPTQVMGMVFSNMKTIAEKNLNAAVVDCCIGVPIYFTELQRRAVMDAATIAGLHPLRLINETTATALLYGIYKTDLPENEQLNVAFVDIGHASMQVCIAGFKKGQLKILAHSFDRCLGGRDFDEALFQHFAKKFKAEYKIDVFQNPRACLRLRAACEKLKKVLSANPEAPMNIECLMDGKDVRGFIKRDEFEQIITPILERVKQPLEKALSEARLTVDNINAVEVVGSGSRVPAVIKILTEFFGKEPRYPMNASECVSKGCALECAILSPTYKVREFQVQESFPFSIALTWKGSAQDSHNGNVENQPSRIVFPKGNPIPSVKALTFYRTGTFTVDLQYADVTELQAPPKISTYTIGPFQTTKGERAKVKVKARLNLHGIVSVESADLIEEEVEVLVSKEPSKIDTDNAHLVEASKKKLKKFNVPVSELVYGAMLPSDVQKAVEKELEMVLQDRTVEVTKDKRDAVDAYVYDMRNKLIDEEKLEVLVPKESSKMDMNKTPADAPPTNDSDLNMQDVSMTENGAPEAGDNPAPSDNNHVHAKTNEDLVEMFDNTQHQNIGKENEDEVTSSTSTNQRSNVWDCFEQLSVGPDGVKKASCIACGKVYVANPNSGTSNMKQHILTCFNFNQSGRPPKIARLDQAVYREKMAIAIVKHNYPFSYVEHDATRQLHKFLHQGVNSITRNTAREDVIRIYEREKTTLKQKLEKVTSRICLTSNLWNSITTDTYMALTAHYVDENWVLRKRVLNFRAIPPPYSGPILAECTINLLRDWGIENKIFTITLGYEKYHDGLIDSLRGHFRLNNVLVCDGDYMHVHCGAHILTLIVQAGLKTIEGSIEKLRDSVKYIRGSFTRKLKFAECIAQLSLQCGRHVRQDIITRWNSTYLMLDCALIYQHAYVQLELVDSDFKTNLSQEEWTRVARITRLLKPLYEITTLFSGGSYPTSNLYFQKVWKTQLYIQEEIHSSDPIISRMAKDMKTEFDKYWETYCMILSFAVILDPRYKVKLVEYCFSKLDMEDRVREEKLKSILDGLDKLYKEYENPYKKMHDSSVRGSSDVGINPLDDLDGFESFKSQFGRVERDKMQLKMYLAEPALDRRQNIDILQFWKDNEWRYPQLALMARDILSIPITTVVPNSSFSIGDHVLRKYGSSLL